MDCIRRYREMVESLESYEGQRSRFLVDASSALTLLVKEFGAMTNDIGSFDLSDSSRRPSFETMKFYSSLRAVIGDSERYQRVFDPYSGKKVTDGDLALDLSEIYDDIVRASASSEERDLLIRSYWNHWGRHAVFALVAIHHIFRDEVMH